MEGNKRKDDPGWNDPPMLNYSESNPAPKSRITNKRVAFPLNTSSPSTGNAVLTTTINAGQLPLPRPRPPMTCPLRAPPVDESHEFSSKELLEKTKDNFDYLVINKKIVTTRENLNLLYIVWEEGKLPMDCQKTVYLLSKHLVEDDVTEQLKEKLLLEFRELCEPWLNEIVF